MFFVLNRDRALVSTMGLSVNFKKDVPVFVPPPLWREAREMGAEPTDELPEDTGVAVSKAPTDPAEREQAIREAIEALTLRNQRDDFNAGGKPNLKPLADFLGWSVSAKERDLVMLKMANSGD